MTPRFKLPPGGDVPPVTAARRMGLSLDAFRTAISFRGFFTSNSLIAPSSDQWGRLPYS